MTQNPQNPAPQTGSVPQTGSAPQTEQTPPTQQAPSAEQVPSAEQAPRTHRAGEVRSDQRLRASDFFTSIAEYREYTAAQSAVDTLSDRGFEVDSVRIVGHDLKSVEAVRGRMTYGRAALYGAGSGAWFGLLIGLLLSIFLIGAFLGPLISAIVIGAIWGAIFGLIAFAATGNARNFSSRTSMAAERYTVDVAQDRADAALEVLSQGTPQQS